MKSCRFCPCPTVCNDEWKVCEHWKTAQAAFDNARPNYEEGDTNVMTTFTTRFKAALAAVMPHLADCEECRYWVLIFPPDMSETYGTCKAPEEILTDHRRRVMTIGCPGCPSHEPRENNDEHM